MFKLHDLARVIYSFLIKKGDAQHNLQSYLELHLRPEIIGTVNFKNIFRYIGNKVGEDVDKKIFLEDLVDEFIKDAKGDELEPLLVSKAKRKFGLESEKAHDIIGTKKVLKDPDKDTLKTVVKEFTPLISKYLLTYFDNQSKKWVGKKEQEPRLTENMPEPSIPPEHEMEVEMKERQGWQEGLIKDIIDVINRKVSEERRPVYKLILKDMLLAAKPKTLKEMEGQTSLSEATISRYKDDLIKILAAFLKAQGLGGGYLEEGGLARKEIVYPEYQEFLKDKKNSDDLKEFIDNKVSQSKARRPIDERSTSILKLLAEGKHPSEIITESIPLSRVRTIKFEKFDPWYKDWYKEKVDDIRKAHFYIKKAFMVKMPYEIVTAKKVVIPYEKKKGPENVEKEEAVTQSHETLVNNAVDKHQILATISFKADYDNIDVVAGKKDPEKDPINFEYKSYEASLYAERSFGKTERSVDYTYKQDLKEDGSFEGSGVSILQLDGKEASSSHDLKKELDRYVEHHMKPEGMLPFGRAMSKKTKNIEFPVQYLNKKTNKKYHGVRDFFEKYKGLLKTDKVHEEREKYVEVREKGRILPINERKKINEMIFDLKETLEEEKKNKDWEAVKRIKEEMKKLEGLLSKEKIDEDIESIIEEERGILKEVLEDDTHTAATFPSPGSEKVKELLIILDSHKVTKPNPYGWLEPVELLALAKALKAHVKIDLERDLKELKKQKGLKRTEKDSKAHDLESKAREEIIAAKESFKDFPVDLEKRRNTFKKEHPEDFKTWGERKNWFWVDNKDEVNRIVSKINQELSEEIKTEKPREKQIMRVIEKGKYKSLEYFLEQSLIGIATIADKFKNASLTEKGMDADTKDHVEKVLNKALAGLEETKKELEKISEGAGADTEVISNLRKKIPEYFRDIKAMKSYLQSSKEIPALTMAHVLLDHVTYFSSIYSFLSSILWFGQYALITKAKDETEETQDIKALKEKIVNIASMTASYNILAKDQIKAGLSKLKDLLKKFGKLLGESLTSDPSKLHGLKTLQDPERSRFPSQITKPIEKAAEEEDYEQARIKAIFPADELRAANKVIKDLGSEKKTAPKAEIAQKELHKIVSNVSTAYKEGLESDTIKALADKEGIPYKDAAVRLKRIQDALSKHALSMFILRWQEPKKKKKDRSPLGNRPDTEYEAMGEFVERHLPDLFKLAPPADDIPKEPSRGIPTPKKIRESLEKMFSSKSLPKWVTEREKVLFPEEVGEIKEEVDPFGKAYMEGIEGVDGGGGGGHSKTRSKVVKPPVPSAAFEALKDTIIQKFDKPAEYIVLSTLAFYVKKIRDTIKATKEEEYIDVGDVVDGLVSLLKRLYYFITHLVVEPSTKEWKLPPEGAPKSSGRPDIVINNMADVKKVYDKILEIYKIINHYIKPDTVGIPPEDISSLRGKSQQMKRYLPIGLIDWYPVFQREEEKKNVKKAHISSMAYKIALKYAKQRVTESAELF